MKKTDLKTLSVAMKRQWFEGLRVVHEHFMCSFVCLLWFGTLESAEGISYACLSCTHTHTYTPSHLDRHTHPWLGLKLIAN